MRSVYKIKLQGTHDVYGQVDNWTQSVSCKYDINKANWGKTTFRNNETGKKLWIRRKCNGVKMKDEHLSICYCYIVNNVLPSLSWYWTSLFNCLIPERFEKETKHWGKLNWLTTCATRVNQAKKTLCILDVLFLLITRVESLQRDAQMYDYFQCIQFASQMWNKVTSFTLEFCVCHWAKSSC
jgi:hypothetical protein